MNDKIYWEDTHLQMKTDLTNFLKLYIYYIIPNV